jgi:hypothetical protein
MTTTELTAQIDELAPEQRMRVNWIAELIRGQLMCDVQFETELAMWLVQSEIEETDLETDVPAELDHGTVQ